MSRHRFAAVVVVTVCGLVALVLAAGTAAKSHRAQHRRVNRELLVI